MRSVILIAANFIREQRWALFFLLLWVVGFAIFGLFVNSRSAAEDALMIFKQLAFYGIVFAVFFGSSALNSDLRSRRILAVLSKPVSRAQYLQGLLAGMAAILGIFCLCAGLCGSWVLGRYGLDQAAFWLGILALVTACILTAAIALCFSVFLPPLFAAIGSGILTGIPVLLALRGVGWSKYLVPVYALLEPQVEADFNMAGHASIAVIILGWLETLLLLLLTTWIFSRRDLVVGED